MCTFLTSLHCKLRPNTKGTPPPYEEDSSQPVTLATSLAAEAALLQGVRDEAVSAHSAAGTPSGGGQLLAMFRYGTHSTPLPPTPHHTQQLHQMFARGYLSLSRALSLSPPPLHALLIVIVITYPLSWRMVRSATRKQRPG
jgi:hypothetical protein